MAKDFTWETAMDALWTHFDGMYGADHGEQIPANTLDKDRRDACDKALSALTWLRDGVSAELPGDAERYTVLRVPNESGFDGVESKVRSAEQLGLEWFVVPDGRDILVYVFFDKAGARNYLLGLYSERGE